MRSDGTISGGDGPEDNEPLTASEWAAINRFHGDGIDWDNWSQKEIRDLMVALDKTFHTSFIMRGGEFVKIDNLREWLKKLGAPE